MHPIIFTRAEEDQVREMLQTRLFALIAEARREQEHPSGHILRLLDVIDTINEGVPFGHR